MTNSGLILKGDGGSAWFTTFWSREVTESLGPRLVVDYTASTPTAPRPRRAPARTRK